MIYFKARGPFEIPFSTTKTGAKRVESSCRGNFWRSSAGKYRSSRGCYIFAVRTPRSYVPGYVGKADARFEGEVFTDGKLQRYNSVLANYKKGTPTLFFIIAPTNKGKPNKSKIAQLERYLIREAKSVNPSLMNKIGIKAPRWGIKGVIRGGKGKAAGTNAARAIRQMIGLSK